MNTKLLVQLTKRDFKLRYLGSLMGSYWNLIHPLVMIAIYTLVFSKVMKSRLGVDSGPFSYSVYLCSGLISWNLLSEIINRGVGTLLESADFIKKLSFDPLILFFSTAASSLVNFVIAFGIFLSFLIFIKPPPPSLLMVYFFVVFLLMVFSLGAAVGLGCLNVFMRDVQQMVSVTFQLWFWFTPIVYATSALPGIATKLLLLNPAYAFIEPMHILLYEHRMPEAYFWALMLGWVVAATLFAAVVYRKTISYVRDYL